MIQGKEYENVCFTFYAEKGTKDKDNFYCGYSMTIEGGEVFNRSDPNNLICKYKAYSSDTGADTTAEYPAKCGLNKDTDHYCPKWKGEFDFAGQMADYRKMWNNTFNCHIETNQLYCKDVHDKGYRSLMADWLKDIIETANEDSYALYANNDECMRKIVNRGYWQVRSEIDSAFSLSNGLQITLALVLLMFYFA
uniref:Uncharacterized protein n=1 Tax=Euplotes harpa TaxID=151035 RepID=A0A7S3J7M0_9SPIT|mmetsp:Transcript_19652/g.22865  ORF Transcript_19652/g.22865 Transcript_19652/m.22865 type:complete len:194 (+) Transcript_19652:532-1113(+)